MVHLRRISLAESRGSSRFFNNKVVSDFDFPMILFGAFGIVGGLCALLLPDTVGFPLPNTFEDVENIKKNSKPIWKCHTASNDD